MRETLNNPGAVLALMLALCLPQPAWAGFDLDALMAELAQAGPIQARYTEVRDSPLLTEPLELRGRLVIDPAAGEFLKTTEGEDAATVRMSGDTVEMSRGGETRQVQLDRYPMMALLVDGLFALARGDRQALEERFDASLKGTRQDWRLTLEPRMELNVDKPSATQTTGLVRLTIHGEGPHFRRMVLEQSAGQRTVMTFRPAEGQ